MTRFSGLKKFGAIVAGIGVISALTLVVVLAEEPSPTASRGLTIGEPTQAPAANGQKLFPPRSPAVPTQTPSISPHVTPAEAKSLLRQYGKAQDNEMAALKHRQKAELKELKAAHKAQLGEWEAKERDARHKYFAEHKSGPDRRTYVQDYTRRREILLKIQSDDEDRRSQEQSVRLDSLKSDQSQRLKEFQDDLNQGVRPPVTLWPMGS